MQPTRCVICSNRGRFLLCLQEISSYFLRWLYTLICRTNLHRSSVTNLMSWTSQSDLKLVIGAEGMMIAEQLDREWVELMKTAKQQGLTKEEIRQYIKRRSNQKR